MLLYLFLLNYKLGTQLLKVYKALEMTTCKKLEKLGFFTFVLMKKFLCTNSHKCILCYNRLVFIEAQLAKQATDFLSEGIHKMEKRALLS